MWWYNLSPKLNGRHGSSSLPRTQSYHHRHQMFAHIGSIALTRSHQQLERQAVRKFDYTRASAGCVLIPPKYLLIPFSLKDSKGSFLLGHFKFPCTIKPIRRRNSRLNKNGRRHRELVHAEIQKTASESRDFWLKIPLENNKLQEQPTVTVVPRCVPVDEDGSADRQKKCCLRRFVW